MVRSAVPTVTELLLARATDPRPGLIADERRWSWARYVSECADRAALLQRLHRDGPFHIGVLLDNVAEYAFLLGAAALSGAVLVGLNTSRRGDQLARDVRLSHCQVVITDSRYVELLDDLDLGAATGRVMDADSASWHVQVAARAGSRLDPVPAAGGDLLMLAFTSGTTAEPRAVRISHQHVALSGQIVTDRCGLSSEDVIYLSMPLFHISTITGGWAAGLACGATVALRNRFSAATFIDDVRAVGATYTTYVGHPLCAVLATPPRPDDADNTLRLVVGTEAAERDVIRFRERFDCQVYDGYCATEGGVLLSHPGNAPPGAIGRLHGEVELRHERTGRPVPPAAFNADGRLLNAEDAIGELVNTAGAGAFAGYYQDPDANGRRLRDGRFHSGDLAYRDEEGFVYFVDRADDWLLVDGEHLAVGPIERILLRHPDIADVAVYAVPDAQQQTDQVMAAVVLRAGVVFDPAAFADFLAAQRDLGPRQVPRFVRVARRLPKTATFKVIRRTLATQGLRSVDPVWGRDGALLRYERIATNA